MLLMAEQLSNMATKNISAYQNMGICVTEKAEAALPRTCVHAEKIDQLAQQKIPHCVATDSELFLYAHLALLTSSVHMIKTVIF